MDGNGGKVCVSSWGWLNEIRRKVAFNLYYLVQKREHGLCISVRECRKLIVG